MFQLTSLSAIGSLALRRKRKFISTILSYFRNSSSKKENECGCGYIGKSDKQDKEKNKIPTVKLNNGMKMPIIGLGTWGETWPKRKLDGTLEKNDDVKKRVKSEKVKQVIKDAIDIGYRQIDGAHLYHNENEVGEAVREKICEGVISREDMFMVTKLWNTYHRPDMVREACETSFVNLRLDYIDLYLINFPVAYKAGHELFPADKCGHIAHSNVDYVDTWREMEKLVASGLVKAIGVSNFNKRQIKRILNVAHIPPVVNQVECHPYLNQRNLMQFLKENEIALTAYSPLGSPNRPWATKEEGDPSGLMKDAKIIKLAKKHKKHPAQILIRYQIQRGNIVIPKATNKKEARTNFQVFDFKLSKDEMKYIDGLNRQARAFYWDTDCSNKHYPFFDPY